MDRILNRKPTTMRELNEAWFGYYRPDYPHYCQERYRDLNLCNLWSGGPGTLELRCYGHKSIMGT